MLAYTRQPIKTHLIHIKEPILPIIKEKVIPQIKSGDFIAISEKFVTISQGRVIHKSAVHPGLLAKLVVSGVTKYKNDIGYSSPYKMQVAIYQAGWWRILLAMILGGITRLFGRRGDFYRIAGHKISEIDGFNPDAIKPFDEFAMLGPDNPDGVCQKIEDKFNIPCIIVDANNINTEVLGMSKKVLSTKDEIRKILHDNPMGQADELTPIVIIRKK
ncbi:MAG: hypothetical protein M1338_04505 [Patescibacteria group bacterium]|nr:hypothetical protein [Patescibacteria group bacterium]